MVAMTLSSCIIVLVAIVAVGEGTIDEIADRCCAIGEQWFTQNRERCTDYPSPLRGVAEEDKAGCLSVIQVCCLQERQENQCQRGKQNARIRGSCDGLHSRLGSEDTRECCHCCKIGLEARESGVSCDVIQQYGGVCNDVIQECCESGGQGETPSGPGASGEPDSETDAPTALGYCEQFPGQLCDHICVDIPSSYRCRCQEGFSLGPNGRSCTQDELSDRCAQNNPCMHQCEDTGYAIVCRCFEGYVNQPDGHSCADIDECLVGTHMCSDSQRCVNRPGNYICEALPRGDETLGAQCLTGYVFSTSADQCQDVDECSTGDHNCLYNQVCMNTEGGFICQEDNSGSNGHFNCRQGFTYNTITRSCEDLDECVQPGMCEGSHQSCHNSIGTYMCLCDPGFRYHETHEHCEDINECALNRDSCMEGQQCENTIGSYVCRRAISCGTGYTLDKDSQRCLDDDECNLGVHNCGPAYECQNTEGSFRCVPRTCERGSRLDYSTGECVTVVCNRGMRPDRSGNCIDVNECVERPNACRANQECRNTVGSYTCRNLVTCGPGFELNEVGSACTDIDECTRGTNDCTGSRNICINRSGTYICECPDGFQMNHRSRNCEDIDECEQFRGQICSLTSTCENSIGSYRCLCKEGFRRDGDHCVDVDECEMPNLCQHHCRNNWGSYACTCNSGWQLAEDGRSCRDVDECSMWLERGGALCIGLCQNTPGSYTCSCPEGYLMLGDARTCQDVDECSIGTANCNGPDDICINTRGGFKCQTVTCPNGFVKAASVGSRNNNVRCQRQTFVCPQGDTECLYAPLSYSVNFITFPSEIRVPADLFTMRGPLSPYRRLEFELQLKDAHDPRTGVTRVGRDFFHLRTVAPNEVVVQLLRQIEGPQDIELQLDMKIYSKEFSRNNGGQEMFFGTAVAKILIFVTGSDW